MNKILYHYTSIEALYGIIESESLWLTNANSSNDKSEINYYLDILKKAISNQKIIQNIEDAYSSADKYPYIFCMSKSEEDAAQWDRYADFGHGVCISINTKYLCAKLKSELFDISPLPVIYKYNQKKDIIYQSITNDGDLANKAVGFETNILYNALRYKNYCFRKEEEIRISVTSNDYLFAKNEFQSKAYIDYKLCKNAIKEVLILPVEPKKLIKKILIGPRSNQTEEILKRYLHAKNIDNIEVEKSKCPLR